MKQVKMRAFTIHCGVRLEMHRWGQTLMQHAQQQDIAVEHIPSFMAAGDIASLLNALDGAPVPLMQLPALQQIQSAMQPHKHSSQPTNAVLYDPSHGNVELYTMCAMIDRASIASDSTDPDAPPAPLIAIAATHDETLSVNCNPTILLTVRTGDVVIARGRILCQLLLRQLAHTAIVVFTGTRTMAHEQHAHCATEYRLCASVTGVHAAMASKLAQNIYIEVPENVATPPTCTANTDVISPIDQWVEYVARRVATAQTSHTGLLNYMGVDHAVLFRAAFRATVSDIAALPVPCTSDIRKNLSTFGFRGRPRDKLQDECIRQMASALNDRIQPMGVPFHVLHEALLKHTRRMHTAEKCLQRHVPRAVWQLPPVSCPAAPLEQASLPTTTKGTVCDKHIIVRIVMSPVLMSLITNDPQSLTEEESILLQRVLVVSRQLGYITVAEHQSDLQIMRQTPTFAQQTMTDEFIFDGIRRAGATIEVVPNDQTDCPDSQTCTVLVLHQMCFGTNTREWTEELNAVVRRNRLACGGLLILQHADANARWPYRALLYVRAILLHKYRSNQLGMTDDLISHVQTAWTEVAMRTHPMASACLSAAAAVSAISSLPGFLALFTKSVAHSVHMDAHQAVYVLHSGDN